MPDKIEKIYSDPVKKASDTVKQSDGTAEALFEAIETLVKETVATKPA